MMLRFLSLCLLFSYILSANENDLNNLAPDNEFLAVEAPEDSVVMPNTLNTLGEDDSGNWVKKRVWWERAEDAFGKIMALNLQISQQQIEYFGVRNEIDKQLDAGKRELALSFAQFDKVISQLLDLVGSTESLSELDLAKDSFKGSVWEKRDKLLKLKEDLSQLIKLDEEMDSAIIKVIDQVQRCNDYEARAWEDFKQIGRILNDEQAKSLYYQVVNYRKNIKIILRYLKVDLRNSFESLMTHAIEKLDDIKQAVAHLRDAGIDLVYESKMITEGGHYSEAENKKEEQSSQTKKPKKDGFFASLTSFFNFLKNLLLWLPRKLLGLFGIKF